MIRFASEDRPVLSGLLALMVTDLAGFTPMVERLGDEPARDLMQLHDRLVRRSVADQGGCEVAHTGDGVMTAFRSVSAALQAACEIQRLLGQHTAQHPDKPLRPRIGIHAGEPVPADGRLIGTCVNTAVRVCDAADAERVLVTDLACHLAAGKAFVFGRRQALELKGLSTRVTAHELLWRAPAPGAGTPSRRSGCRELSAVRPDAAVGDNDGVTHLHAV